MLTIAKLRILLWISFTQARSYRLGFTMQTVGFFLPIFGLFFMGQLFGEVEVPAIADYGGNYATFVFVAFILTSITVAAMASIVSSVRRAQTTGTLETLIMTRASIPTIIFGWALYPLAQSSLRAIAMMIGGMLVLGVSLAGVNVASALLTLFFAIIVMGSIGIFSASFTLVFKQSDPFTRILLMATSSISGAVFPVSILPDWLQTVAWTLPQTHALEAMRLSVLTNASIGDLSQHLYVLGGYAVILALFSILVFESAIDRAKYEGSLAHY